MTKYPYILFVLLLASFSSCQTVEQLSIDYMLPAEISFPNELKRVAVVNNVSDTPDNTLPPKDNTMNSAVQKPITRDNPHSLPKHWPKLLPNRTISMKS